jgi:putative transposase
VNSAKEEALTRMLLFGEWPLLWVLGGNVTHFREERLHQGKGNVILFPSA